MRLTLGKALPLLARYAVSGACETDPRVIEKINEARERLMTKPEKWKGKTQRFAFCVNRGCITLPREILTIEGIASTCGGPLKLRNQWYEVVEGGPGPVKAGASYNGSLVDRGDGFVTFADPTEPTLLKIYADVPEASGARLLIQGFDEDGNRVQTFDQNEGYVDGEYVAISNGNPAVTVTKFASIDGVQKPVTNGFVRIYAYTPGSAGSDASDTTTTTEVATLSTTQDGNPFMDFTTTIFDTGATVTPGWGESDGDGAARFIVWHTQSETVTNVYLFAADGSLITYQEGVNYTTPPVPRSIGVGDFVIDNMPGDIASAGACVILKVERSIVPAVAPVDPKQSVISILHPDDEAPSYRRYYLPEMDSQSGKTLQVVVMATMRYLPIRRKSDFMVIEHVGALKQMLLAINEEEKGMLPLALQYEANAARLLAGEVANFVGDSATANAPVQVDSDGFGAGDIVCPL